jgi:LCP family protein required for cell wall assembly
MLGALVGVFLLATALSGYLVFATVRDVVAGWAVTSSDAVVPSGEDQPNGSGTGGSQGSGSTVSIVPQKWSGTDRVTVLVLGIDRRQGETDKGYRSDTMLLLTVDPVAKTAAMLSIPRDLWVEIPGYGVNKINTANSTGDFYDYPGGGAALAVKTIEHNFGVEVNYYVRLDFTAFETFVDLIGGIDVDNPEEINDPEYPDGSYGYEPFYLPAGRVHLNGHDALRYARTRHTSQGDIDRAHRQQQVILAVRQKVLSLNMLPTLIAQAPALYQTLKESVQTNLSLDQIVSLALLAPDISEESIQREVIDYRYVIEETTPDNQSVLVPLRDKIRELRDSLFTTSAPLTPASAAEETALIAAEAARVEVLNGAGVDGLARDTSEWLKTQGINVVAFDTADRLDYASSVIVVYSGKPYTTTWLQRTFHVTSILSGTDPNSPVDVKIILGTDWQVPTGTTP